MSTPQNTSAVNASDTAQYFNNFYIPSATVSANQNDAVVAYFEKYTQGNKVAAQALASAVIFTSLAQGSDPMNTISQFMKLPIGDLNAYLTMFLNLNRVGTSYLGVNNQPVVNKYIKRAIIV